MVLSKKHFSGLVVLFFLLTNALACRKTGPKMPAFTFETAAQKPFSRADIDVKKNAIFVFFSPTCHHCENEARDLVQHIDKFGQTDIYWISKAEWSDIRQFDSTFTLSAKGMHVLRDAKGEGKARFQVSDIPDIFVYDTYQELVVEYVSEAKTSDLLKDIGVK